MQKKLFVGGLSWNTDDNSLHKAFEAYGEIEEAKIIKERDSGKSRGFGFVTFATQEQAQKALELDGSELDGRSIKVNIAQEKPRTGGGGGGDRNRW